MSCKDTTDRDITRPMKLVYNCSDQNYDKFCSRRDELGITTDELFDRLLKKGNEGG